MWKGIYVSTMHQFGLRRDRRLWSPMPGTRKCFVVRLDPRASVFMIGM
jgi:hypothetical protein